MGRPPDFIFHNGLILSGAPTAGSGEQPPPPTAVAVRGGTIEAVGDDEVLRSTGPSTTLVDLDGRTLLPGVNDGHLHLSGYAQSRPPVALDVSPEAVSTVREVAALVADRAAATPPGTWIRGLGWVGRSLTDLVGGEPSAELLDPISPDHPVVLTDFSGHTIWVNSAAMRAAGVTRSSAVPTGGLARRSGDGEFTGLFTDAARTLIDPFVPALNHAELEAAIRDAVAELHRQGITSVTDAALSPQPGGSNFLGGPAVYDLLARICGPHDLRIRTNALVTFSPLGASFLEPTEAGLAGFEPPETDPRWFAVRGLKVFADGVPPSCTAWMSMPYPDGSHGCMTVGGDTDDDRVEELGRIIRAGHQAGLQVAVHATGDRTTEAVIDGFAAALAEAPRSDHRHYVIHGPLVPEPVIGRAAELGIGFNVQPSLKSTSARSIEALFGRELSEYQWPLRSIVESGCPMAASSDAPICRPNWRHGVAGAVLRETTDGEVYGADQRIGVDQAIAAYTSAGAWQDGAERWKGTLEVGKAADLCVVDARLSTDDPRTYAGSDVSLTMVDGVVVHGEAS